MPSIAFIRKQSRSTIHEPLAIVFLVEADRLGSENKIANLRSPTYRDFPSLQVGLRRAGGLPFLNSTMSGVPIVPSGSMVGKLAGIQDFFTSL
jgi:hypothetical protein